MRRIADKGKFLTSASYERLDHFAEQVDRIRCNGSTSSTVVLQIARETPIETRKSVHYRPGAKPGDPVIGSIAATWPVRPVGNRRRRKFQSFIVDTASGAAATRLSIRTPGSETQEQTELASWHVDIRASNSPGCYHHFQVLGESDELPFPDCLGIPRFPDPFVSPMALLEFLLCELFPIEWTKHLSDGPHSSAEWRQTQKDSWIERLSMELQTVRDCTSLSPWLSLRKWPG